MGQSWSLEVDAVSCERSLQVGVVTEVLHCSCCFATGCTPAASAHAAKYLLEREARESHSVAPRHSLMTSCTAPAVRMLPAGRMYVQTGSDSSVEMPIYFALFQACTADGKFATTPGARALPALGGLTLPGGYVF